MNGRGWEFGLSHLLSDTFLDYRAKSLMVASSSMVSAKVDPCDALEATCFEVAFSALDVVLRATLAQRTLHRGGAVLDTRAKLTEAEDALLYAASAPQAPERAELEEIARRAVALFRELLGDSDGSAVDGDVRQGRGSAGVDQQGDSGADEQVRRVPVGVVGAPEPDGADFAGGDRRPGGVPDLVSDLVADGEAGASVDERGHGSPSVGARVLVTPDAAGLTVGAPTDTSADPSAGGVSVDLGYQAYLLGNDIAWLTITYRPGSSALAEQLVDCGWRKP